MTTPESRAREQRAARRAAVKAHHPDLGGNPDDLRRALATLAGPASVASPPPPRLRRRMVGHVRTLRAALPRRCPGARRYAEL